MGKWKLERCRYVSKCCKAELEEVVVEETPEGTSLCDLVCSVCRNKEPGIVKQVMDHGELFK